MAMLGCGAIGGAVADAVLAGDVPGVRIVAIASMLPEPPQTQALGARWTESPEELAQSGAEVILEAASQSVARKYAVDLLRSGKHLILMSVGALADSDFLHRLIEAARDAGREIVVPAGAIGGLDILRSARQRGALSYVTLTTAKHPRGLAGAPYVAEHHIDVLSIESRQVLFDGNAQEAVAAFPQNVNVAASVSLAGLGFERTRVQVVADPDLKRTTHLLEAGGLFGELKMRLENAVHPQNPKTSYLACLSAIEAVSQFKAALRVGG
jgi:aspartate dehydrogenase